LSDAMPKPGDLVDALLGVPIGDRLLRKACII
jgi:hypothetical protein